MGFIIFGIKVLDYFTGSSTLTSGATTAESTLTESATTATESTTVESATGASEDAPPPQAVKPAITKRENNTFFICFCVLVYVKNILPRVYKYIERGSNCQIRIPFYRCLSFFVSLLRHLYTP